MQALTIGRLWRPIERMFDALTDPVRRERTMVVVLVAYAALWSLYGAIAKGSQDINFDMGEAVAWSREIALGTPKHPPMSAWLVRLWFDVFPLTDWAYYLFAIVLATIALWIAWRLAGDYLDAEKRVVGIALLTLMPFFNFHALRFNANTVLIPFWAATTWWFLRSFETRSLLYAALAGLGAASAMLGKYWSVFLLLGLGMAALADPRRGVYFRSGAPWVTVVVGAFAMAPHVAWIVAHDFAPFQYAATEHAAGSLVAALEAAGGYLAGIAGYVAIPAVLAWVAARPGRSAIVDTLRPKSPPRRLALTAFALPLLLPVAAAIATQAELVSLWAMSAMTLLPVVLLSSPLVSISRDNAKRILALAVAVPLVMIAVSPVIAVVVHRLGITHYATHYRQLAAAMDDAWRASTGKPMRLVGSYTNLVNGLVFYLADRPSTLDLFAPQTTPWADEPRIARDGIALVCPATDAMCMRLMEQRATANPASGRVDVEISRTYFGFSDARVSYVIVIVPPAAP